MQTADVTLVAVAFFVKRGGAIRIDIFVSEMLKLLDVTWVAEVDGLQNVVEF